MALEQAKSKLDSIEDTYEQLNAQMFDPGVIGDNRRYQMVHKTWSDLTPVVERYRDYKSLNAQIAATEAMLHDPEMREMAQEELELLRGRLVEVENAVTVLLLPKDPNDDKNVIVEIRPAAGGDEAALFCGELMRMYTRFAERHNWKVELMNAQESGIGGFSDVSISIQAQGAFSKLKFESGVHRVQRVPVTESSGRIHTSTATVAVMPEVEEVEVEVNQNDIEMDVYHSSSAGGQNVQKVATAIRITHKPTGIVVTCQDERSQFQNKEKAMRMLRSKLYERERLAQNSARTEFRRNQVGTGDRSEKIRTYNFPDGRVTDHRIGKTIYNVPAILDGEIEPFIDALAAADQAEKLRSETETATRADNS